MGRAVRVWGCSNPAGESSRGLRREKLALPLLVPIPFLPPFQHLYDAATDGAAPLVCCISFSLGESLAHPASAPDGLAARRQLCSYSR